MRPVDPRFQPLLHRSLIAFGACVALVTCCYLFVDRPVAFFIHDRGINRSDFLKWETEPPPIIQAWAPVVLVALAIRRAWSPFHRWELALFTSAVALVLADQFRDSLGFVAGRYWPDTWIQDNPSLIRDGAYGFHPFHSGAWYDSFPSGHTARVLGLVTVWWIAYPGSRWACAAAASIMAAALVGMNYHFVSDVVAGGFIGAAVGTYSAYFAGLNESAE